MTNEEFNIASAANGILFLWKTSKDEGQKEGFHLAIKCMMFNELIEDYDVASLRVKIGGKWTSSIRTIKV